MADTESRKLRKQLCAVCGGAGRVLPADMHGARMLAANAQTHEYDCPVCFGMGYLEEEEVPE